MKKRAVFFDRDGTLNDDVGYPKSFDQIRIYSFSYEAVRKAKEAGLLAVIVTNQSGIGRGLLTEKNLSDIHQKLRVSFAAQNVFFDGIYFCPHYALSSSPRYRKDCICRKPEIGMAIRAATDLQIDLKRSYVIGDKVEDILFGINIQASPILVLTGYGQEARQKLEELQVRPSYIAQNVLEAVHWILDEEKKMDAVSE
ncbi:MAG: HAD family hydrolase [Candidatus Aminicenantales bacterium]